MQVMIQPFKPIDTASTTTNAAVTGSSAQITLPSMPNASGTGNPVQFRFTNIGTQTIFWAWGTVTASVSTSTPMLSNTCEVFTAPDGITTISVIAATTGSTLYVTGGFGQ